MPLPILEREIIHTFLQGSAFLCQESCKHGDDIYLLGTTPNAWKTSELSWDNGDPAWGTNLKTDPSRGAGRWRGPGALHVRANDITIDGATMELQGHDEMARVSSTQASSGLRARWHMFNPGFVGATGTLRCVLQDALSGGLLLNTVRPSGNSGSGEVFETGTQIGDAHALDLPSITADAILWVALENAQSASPLPPDYFEVRGVTRVDAKFKYIENDIEYVWDYEYNVGRMPLDQAHPFYALHEELWLEGKLLHRGDWSQYLTSGVEKGGTWSALRIKVGAGSWQVGANYQPYPGAVAYRVLDVDSKVAVLLDPLATSATAWATMKVGDEAGESRIGGTIATRNGPATAYWRFHPETPVQNATTTLLGVSGRNYVPVCEASLYPTVSDILELDDGRELVLSYSHLYEYSSDGATLDARLPGLPQTTLGHPGGRCLRTVENRVQFFTESFGGVGAGFGDDNFGQFYNTLRTLDARQTPSTGKGTVFHSDCCADVVWGRFYGVVQDKSAGDPTALRYIATLQNGRWVASGMAPFSGSSHSWQRVRAVADGSGIKLVVSGKETTSEGAIWGVADGTEMRETSLHFRPRRLTRVLDVSGGAYGSKSERLYCVGRMVERNSSTQLWECALNQTVVAITGNVAKLCFGWDDDLKRFWVERETFNESGLLLNKVPTHLWWFEDDASTGAGGYWMPRMIAPTDGRAYLLLGFDDEEVFYTPRGGLPLNELPYDSAFWSRLCFTIYDDGSAGTDAITPDTFCGDAQCVLDSLGGKYATFTAFVTGDSPWDAIQVSDLCAWHIEPNGQKRVRELTYQARSFPNLWARVDSPFPANELRSYTQRLSWNRFQALAKSAKQKVEVCVLVPLNTPPITAPAITPR